MVLRRIAASWRARALVVIIVLQAICMFFFVGDVVMDYRAPGLKIAADAFGDMIRQRFGSWALSPAEHDVVLMTLKGFDAPETAQFRRTE